MPLIYLLLIALFTYIAWIDLSKATLLTVVLLPSYLLRLTIVGIPTTFLELMILVLVVVWLSRKPSFHLSRTWLVPIGLLLLAASVGVVVAPDTSAALGIWKAYFIEPVAFFAVVFSLLRRKQIAKDGLIKALGLSALIVSVVGILQWITHAGIPIPWDIEGRVTGVFDYPNALGLYLGPIATISFIHLLSAKTRSAFWMTVSLASGIAVVLAQSEAAWVAIIASLSLYGISRVRLRKHTLSVLIIAVLAVLVITPLRSVTIEKLALQDYSGQVRISQWQETNALLKDHALLGVGLSGYPSALEPYHQAQHYEIFQYPHNIFLNIWVELGLLGLLAFLLLSHRILATEQFHPKTWSMVTFALATMFIHGLVDVPYFKNDLALMTWLLIALVVYDQTLSSKTQQ